MRLRSKVIFCIILTTACLVAGLHLFLPSLLLRDFRALERDDMTRNLQRVRESFLHMSADLHVKTSDWSDWDDTYQFMQNHNRAYIESNLVAESMVKLKVDLVLFIAPDKSLFHAMPVPRIEGVTPPDAKRTLALLTERAETRKLFGDPEGFQGAVAFQGRPLFVSVRPVRTTSGKGAPRGWFAFCSYFTEQEIALVKRRTQLEIAGFEANGALPADVKAAFQALSPQKANFLKPQEPHILGYTLVRDVFQQPLMVFKITEPRRIVAQGARSATYLTRLVIGTALAFSVVILALFETAVLRRLSSLAHQVERIRDGRESVQHVTLDGRDELGGLATKVNAMLAAMFEDAERLRQSEEQLRLYSGDLERLVEKRTEQIEFQAYHDALTGLPNRIKFFNRLEQGLARAVKRKTGLAVLFIDLDNFKIVNDSQGHEAGDQLLKTVAERLQACVREGDLTARLGGDEFTLLLENLHSASEAIEIAERILHELAQPVALTQSVAYIGGSIGIVYSEAGDARADILLRDADTAMYHAKTNGKNAFALFEPSMNDRVVERMEIETGLRQALAQNELRVYYQPLLDLTNGKLTGVEALVRWQHPERGLIPPGQFIPIAEETGLILPLGYWVLEEACGQIAQWGQKRPDIATLTLNVNLSGKQLQQDDVAERIAEILRRTEFPPSQLKLEITESVFLDDVAGITQKLGAIKALGVKLAIDDFGTGYSSLSALQEFPVDTVKIDRSFVNRLAEEDGNAIISAIISLSKAMRLDVTGEGIETAEQVALLQELGCDVGQGFFFDRPMPGDAMQARFKTGDANAEPETAERTEQELRALWSRNANDQRKAA